jgi:hypothetical protein
MGLSFNGSNSMLEWTGASSPVTNYPVTIAVWIKPNATTMANTGFIGGIGETIALDGLECLFAGADAGDPIYASSRSGGTATFGAAGLGATQGEWQLAMFYFGSQTSRSARIRSGSEVTDSASNTPTFGGFRRIVFGARPTVSGSGWLNADLARIAIWTSDRRADFATLAAGALPSTISPSTLLDYLELDTLASSYVSAGTSGRTFTASNVTLSADHPAGVSGPSFSANPSNQSVTQPATATFTATYTGTITGHQWQVSTDGGGTWGSVPDGTGASGGAGTGATLTYTTTATAVSSGNHRNNYRYRCRLTHSGGTVDSSAATLTVAAPPLSVTLDALVDEGGTPRAAYTVDKIWAIRASDNTLVATWTAQTTNGSGVLPALTNAALTAVPHVFVTWDDNETPNNAGAKTYTPA